MKAGSLALLSGFAAIIALAGCSGSGGSSAGSTSTTGGIAANGGAKKKLVIAWAQWDPAVQLETLCKDYTTETGTEVQVLQIPWGQFEDKVKLAWTNKSAEYDMIVGDSQWLGTAATNGHYVDLTDWAKDNVTLDDIEPASLKNYGEYEGKMWALPCMSDALGFAYRKDMFEDKANMTAFKAKYGHDLAPPKTWAEFQHVAEFFTHADKKQYGAALFYSKLYDGATMGFEPVLWSYGGDWNNLESPEAQKALEYYVGLKKFCPPNAETFYFDESLRAYQQGQVAMAECWFAFFPGLTDKTKNPHADNTGYFVVPAGPKGQFVSLGGQGISISSYSAQQDESKKFIAWLEKEETQAKWVALGGLTSNKKVASTDAFKAATPYNETFAKSSPFLKDFDNSPNYSRLMQITQTQINDAVAGGVTPAEALKAAAQQMKEASQD
jgi:multiple sugar transport system substrate-binding protein